MTDTHTRSVLTLLPENLNVCCRSCQTALKYSLVDLGTSPLCQKHISPAMAHHMEPFYPLQAFVCHTCFLVQLDEYVSPSVIFDEDYAYFSSYSDSWLAHAKHYAHRITQEEALDSQSLVIEVASNDGYLLQYFHKHGIPVLGIEPTHNTAEAARAKGIRTETLFLGKESAEQLYLRYGAADVLIGNNVLAHVPQLNDFVAGLRRLLKPEGMLSMEFPHLLRLVEGNQFDTIYHEHFSYLSLFAVEKLFERHNLRIFDVEELSTHGGSIRIYAQHVDAVPRPSRFDLEKVRTDERNAGIDTLAYYAAFAEKVRQTKFEILSLLIALKKEGKEIVGYGAPGKGNTLLNYCGIRTDLLSYTVDRNPHKQGNFLPGTRIPIYAPEKIKTSQPDYVFVLPWNLEKEITQQLHYIREWGGKFIIPIPSPRII